MSISITWTTQDVQTQLPSLTDGEAMEVLDYIQENHDANIGINWEIIDMACQGLFNEKYQKHLNNEQEPNQ